MRVDNCLPFNQTDLLQTQNFLKTKACRMFVALTSILKYSAGNFGAAAVPIYLQAIMQVAKKWKCKRFKSHNAN